MGGDLYEGVVAFAPLSPGRESIMLGLVQVGEISPTMHPSARHPTCFRLDLPGVSSRAWHPSRSIEDARRLAAEKIGEWIDAAGLLPAMTHAGEKEI
ncbi:MULTISPECIES: hypothetical protein [unclassified Bradyrhizobium]|uniref:hypothetical protein n=1 Tax=unclassified Bradyrhizobium TaxID=2631580 RepID=UPI002916D8CA|nr:MULTISPECIES: hypothetical protein [unclassified Bradyrhizobium]